MSTKKVISTLPFTMFNRKLHSLQTHQHIRKRRKCFHNALNTIKYVIIWLDATHTCEPYPRRSFSLVTQKRNVVSYPSLHSTQHQIYPSHLAFKYRGFMCTEFLQDVRVDVSRRKKKKIGKSKIQNYNEEIFCIACRFRLSFKAWLLSK